MRPFRSPLSQFLLNSQPLLRQGSCRPLNRSLKPSHISSTDSRQFSSRIFRSFRARVPRSRSGNARQTRNSSSAAVDDSPSLSARMRKLSREYGWSALGVYLGLSALDFPFCFLAVRLLGTDRIGRWEHAVMTVFWRAVNTVYPLAEDQPTKQAHERGATHIAAVADGGAGEVAASEDWTWGVEEAEEANKNKATIWTQLALAYAIHKSFIFIRVPLTAAVTPRVVKTLRGWGWDIGKRRPKIAKTHTTVAGVPMQGISRPSAKPILKS